MHAFLRLLSRRACQTQRGTKYSNNNKGASVAVATLALPVAMFTSNVTKPTGLGPVPEDVEAKSHHVRNKHGETVKFQNPHPSFKTPALREIASMMWGFQFTGATRPKTTGTEVNVVKPELLPSRTGSDSLRATWLGHACYYVEYPSGLRVLFDPVFEDCCAPINLSSTKRFTKPACEVPALPFVDAVVISHSHYDHLSYPTVQEIQKHHPNAHFFVGLGLKKWFNDSGISQVTEMDWWQDVELTLTPQSRASSPTAKGGDGAETKSVLASSQVPNGGGPITARISCLPCQHGSGRSPFDQGKTLWCSWAVSSGTTPTDAKSVWFGGDTGYRAVPKVPEGADDYGPAYKDLPTCPQFRQIGELRGPFDLGLIPIGAYGPRHLFSGVHANPFDAVEIFRDTRCRRAVGIHWGTWVLTYEAVLEPPKLLAEAARRRGLEEGVFGVCDVGETREF